MLRTMALLWSLPLQARLAQSFLQASSGRDQCLPNGGAGSQPSGGQGPVFRGDLGRAACLLKGRAMSLPWWPFGLRGPGPGTHRLQAEASPWC